MSIMVYNEIGGRGLGSNDSLRERRADMGSDGNWARLWPPMAWP